MSLTRLYEEGYVKLTHKLLDYDPDHRFQVFKPFTVWSLLFNTKFKSGIVCGVRRPPPPTLGWSDFHFFLLFSKMGTLLYIGYIFMSLIPKNQRIFLRGQQNFHFLKITGTLKMNNFFYLA